MRILISLCIACLLYVNLAVAAHNHSHIDDTDNTFVLDCDGCNLEQQTLDNLPSNESMAKAIYSKLFILQLESSLFHFNRHVNNKSPPSLLA